MRALMPVTAAINNKNIKTVVRRTFMGFPQLFFFIANRWFLPSQSKAQQDPYPIFDLLNGALRYAAAQALQPSLGDCVIHKLSLVPIVPPGVFAFRPEPFYFS
jgi:hypothetical protein